MTPAWTDRTIRCIDCQGDFVWSVGEQTFYAERGFKPPRRCRACRAAREARHSKSVQQPGGSRDESQ